MCLDVIVKSAAVMRATCDLDEINDVFDVAHVRSVRYFREAGSLLVKSQREMFRVPWSESQLGWLRRVPRAFAKKMDPISSSGNHAAARNRQRTYRSTDIQRPSQRITIVGYG